MHAASAPDPVPAAVAPAPAAPPAPWWRRQGWAVLAVAALLSFIVYERHEAGGWPFASTVQKPAPVVVAQIPTPTVQPPAAVPPPPVPVVAPPPVPPTRPVPPPQPPKELRDCDTCPEMVLVPKGEFDMGIPETETEPYGSKGWDDHARRVHKVTIGYQFYMGRYPVTRGEYRAFAKAGDKVLKPSTDDWLKTTPEQTDRHPVVNVSFEDAEAYFKWLNKSLNLPPDTYRLPSEAEWEYAARAKTSKARYWGDAWDEAGAYTVPRDKGTQPVDARRKNPFELSDMLGHVWQWNQDCWHDNYNNNPPTDGSAWITGGDCRRRLFRGGSWDNGPRFVRAGGRDSVEPASRASSVGFRAARTLSPP